MKSANTLIPALLVATTLYACGANKLPEKSKIPTLAAMKIKAQKRKDDQLGMSIIVLLSAALFNSMH